MAAQVKDESLIRSDANTLSGNGAGVTERRGRDRINDAVGLVVIEVDADGRGGSPANLQSSVNSLFSNVTPVKQLDKYDLAGFAEVKANYPEVADYISSLEEALRTARLNGDLPDICPTHKVSLSSSGLAFADNRLFDSSKTLRLSLLLSPEKVEIHCLARIVSINDAPEVGEGDKHTYRVEFTEIADRDRALIDKHVQGILQEFDRFADTA